MRLRQPPTRPSLKRPKTLVAASAALLIALAVVCLTQFGLIASLWSQAISTLTLVTASGVIKDTQTGQPLDHAPITARLSSFQAQTTTDAQGHFSMRVPNSSHLNISAPGYDAQPMTPGSGLTIELAPNPGATARRYMNAFMQRRFDQLWSMTHPAAQASWGSEAALSQFLTRKFGPLVCVSFNIGQTALLPTWIDPDTTRVYQNAAVLPVSLVLSAAPGILAPPSEQAITKGLFTRLEMAEVKSGKLWRVLVAGPLDREAPIIAPARVPTITARVPILMYHHVSAKPTHNTLDYSLTVKTPDFAAQMKYLAQNHYHPITLTDIFDHLYYGMALPPHPIVLSFDDGYEDIYTDAFPILQQQHFVAEINIITGLIGKSYLTWNQIRQMAAAGVEVGSHTVHHWSLAGVLPQTAESELADSKATLQQQINIPIQFFCYPSGEPFHHGSPEQRKFITTLLSQDGYIGALLDPGVDSAMQNPQYPYQLPRVRVAGGETLDGYAWLLNFVDAGA